MKKILLLISIYISLSFSAYAEIVREVLIKNNNRISNETIITYGQIEIGKDYNDAEINKIIKNFQSIKFSIKFQIMTLYFTLF